MAAPGVTSPFSRVRPIGTGTSQSTNTTLILTRRTRRRPPTRIFSTTTLRSTTTLLTTSKLPTPTTQLSTSTTETSTTSTAATATTAATNTTTVANSTTANLPPITKSVASTDKLTPQPNIVASLSPLYISVGVLAAVVIILAVLAFYCGVYRKRRWHKKQEKKAVIAAEMAAVHSQLQTASDEKSPAGLSVSNNEYEHIDEYESATIYDEIREVPSHYQRMMSTGLDNHLYAETETEQYEEPVSSRTSSIQPVDLSPSTDNHEYNLSGTLPVQEQADAKKGFSEKGNQERKTVSCDTETWTDLSANHIYHEVMADLSRPNSCQEVTEPEDMMNMGQTLV